MVNLLDYYAVNWEATSDNVRAYIRLKGVSVGELAKALFKEKQTIDKWLKDISHPSIDELIFLAKFFDVDLLDILVTNGQLQGPLSEQDYEEAERSARERHKQGNVGRVDTDCEFKYKEDIIFHIFFNEKLKSTYPIRNLNEFLLFLPLVELELFSDVLSHILDNVGTNNHYVFKQLGRLYDSINDDKAKEHIEFLRKFYFQYPSIDSIDDKTELKTKLEKLEEYKKISESEDFIENYRAYVQQLNVFLEKLNLLSELRNRIKNL